MGSLSEARSGACAAQLADGRVLVTGGQGDHGVLDSAELFDFSTDSFRTVAAMATGRSRHTCTTLEDGRVLVVGGENNIGPINLAEIYNPSTNQWSPAGDMKYARAGHTATLLEDGRVVIAGGDGAGPVQNTLEIFGPGPDTFAFVNTAALFSPRTGHGAALLPDGRLLLAGGSAGLDPLASTEIFDPMTETIAAGPRLLTPRSGLTATALLDGRILVAGGTNGSKDLATAEVLDLESGKFVETGSMSVPRRGHVAFLLPNNNQVLVAGGSEQASTAELYTPWLGGFQPAGSLEEPLSGAAGAALGTDGALVLAGGRNRTSRVLGDSSVFGFATLSTDRESYGPGSNVTVTGAGWRPGETVELSLQEVPKRRDVQPVNVQADDSGHIETQISLEGQPVDTVNYMTAQASGATAQIRFANTGANLDQCASGAVSDLPANTMCDASNEWVNGNLNSNKAHYLEGDSLPYRLVFTNVVTGATVHTVTIEWDTTQGGKHALDYITTYNRTQPADPCAGVSSGSGPAAIDCTAYGTPSTFAIPADPMVTDAMVTPIAGVFTLFGGTITGVSPMYTHSGSYAGNSSAGITITFTAAFANPVLAWGGHIATRLDWGQDSSAISISGSPFHTRLLDFDGSGGNQDRALSSEAAIFPVTITIVKNATVKSTTQFDFTATPAPLVNFSLFDDGDPDMDPMTNPKTKVFGSITTFATYTITESVPTGWTSGVVCGVTSANGGSSMTTTNSAALTVKEGENWTCTFNNTAQTVKLTLKKSLTPSTDAGRFDLKAGSTTVVSAAGNGDSGSTNISLTGATTTVALAETASTGSLSNYTSMLTCDKGSLSSNTGTSATLSIGLALAGQEITCTFTNTRGQHSLKLTKTVMPSGDTGKATLNVTDVMSAEKGNGEYLENPSVYGGTSVTVGETANPLYDPSGLSCKQVPSNTAVTFNSGATSISGSFTMPDSNVECTITNTRKAYNVSVKKIVVPATDTGTFTIKVNDTSIGTLGDGETASQTGITAGASVKVEEVANSNYGSTLVCSYTVDNMTTDLGVGNETTSMSFTMPDANVSCTLTNTRNKYTLTLTKHLVPTDDTGTFSLTAGSKTTMSPVGHNGYISDEVYGGMSVTVSEVSNDLYNSSLTCDNPDNSSGTTSATFTMPDQAVNCTVTNTRKPTLTITKICAAAPGDATMFTVNITPPMGQPAIPSEMVGCSTAGGANSFMKVLDAGTYTVAETVPGMSGFITPTGTPPAWTLPTGWTAPGPFSGDCNENGQVTLGTTGNKTCYILNIQSYCTPAFSYPVTMAPSQMLLISEPKRPAGARASRQ